MSIFMITAFLWAFYDSIMSWTHWYVEALMVSSMNLHGFWPECCQKIMKTLDYLFLVDGLTSSMMPNTSACFNWSVVAWIPLPLTNCSQDVGMLRVLSESRTHVSENWCRISLRRTASIKRRNGRICVIGLNHSVRKSSTVWWTKVGVGKVCFLSLFFISSARKQKKNSPWL